MKAFLFIIFICAPIAYSQVDACGGSSQSPIDIHCASSIIKCPSKKSYNVVWPKAFLNLSSSNDSSITRQLDSQNSWLKFTNETNDYTFKSNLLKFVRPSDHAINGRSYDLELYISYRLDDPAIQQYAVLSVLFEVDNSLVFDLFDNYQLHSGNVNEIFAFPFHLSNKPAYHYKGSLTVSPCTQNINYFIHAQPHKITRKNLDKFTARINNGAASNRAHQTLGDRKVYYIGDECQSGVSVAHSM